MTIPKQAIEALKPFAKIADDYARSHEIIVQQHRDERGPNYNYPPHNDSYSVSTSLGNCRRAAAVLAALPSLVGVDQTGMRWEKAEQADIDADAHYLVQHNGHEWRDFDLAVMSGIIVAHRLRPEHVRGRPEWIAKIVRPVIADQQQPEAK